MMQRLVTIRKAEAARPITRSGLLLPLLLICGCGGENTSGTSNETAPPYDPCEESRTLETVLIADFEDVPMVSWYTNSDGTTSDLSPVPMMVPFTTALEAPKCSTDAAAGSGFQIIARGLQGFGYSFGFNNLSVLPNAGGTTYFDVTEWTGISMWVRKGSGPLDGDGNVLTSGSSIFTSLADRFTDPTPTAVALFPAEETAVLLLPDQCPDASLNGSCYCNYDAVDVDGDDEPDPLLSQCDKFGAGVGISTDWRFFKVPFSRMRQRAYGRPSLLPEPDTKILGIEFNLDGENWDFWIDDLAFYREPEAGAVAQ